MPDCFISYSSCDSAFATSVYEELRGHGLDVFMAGMSLQPGDRWSERVHEALGSSKWVVFLASRAACASSYVQQEIGRGMDPSKTLIPVVWDMSPSELPGWVNQIHALDIRGLTPPQIRERVLSIATRIKGNSQDGLWLVAALIAGLLLVALSSESGAPGA